MSKQPVSKTKQRQETRSEINSEFETRSPVRGDIVVSERNSRGSAPQSPASNQEKKHSVKTAFTLFLADYKASHSK